MEKLDSEALGSLKLKSENGTVMAIMKNMLNHEFKYLSV